MKNSIKVGDTIMSSCRSSIGVVIEIDNSVFPYKVRDSKGLEFWLNTNAILLTPLMEALL